ncbi:MAG: benzoate/H(+) symporter BenE family transporter, partial [Thermomicrobiales bacterium]
QVSWYAGTFVTSALAGILLSWRYRMPLPMGWSLPGLIFLAASATTYSHAQIVSGVILAGLIMIAVGASGLADRLMEVVPLPVATGVFAGTVFGYVSAGFDNLSASPFIAGMAITGYFAAVSFNRQWLPPMAVAMIAGLVAAATRGQLNGSDGDFSLAVIAPVMPALDAGSAVAIAIPLVLMAIGLGNLQGLAILKSEGFDPPIRTVTIASGVTTLINAAFGGHVSSLQSNGTAIMATAGAGPKKHRYVSTLIASVAALTMAIAAGSIGALLGIIPGELVTTLASLALLVALLDALRKTISSAFPMSGFVAMMVASSSMSLLGLGSALWGFAIGIAISIVIERKAAVQQPGPVAGAQAR